MEHEQESIERGYVVLAVHEAIGEVEDLLTVGGAEYIHVRRFGPGLDDLYIPTDAVAQTVGKHVYLNLAAPDLVAKAWHQYPSPIARRA